MVAQSNSHTFIARLLTIASFLAAFLSAHSARATSMPVCPSSIVSCGCVITSSGYYEVDGSLSSSQGLTTRGECIAIKSSNVTLNLYGSLIAGPNGATVARANGGSITIGIHVQPGSNNNFIEGAGAMLEGWTVGLQVEGSQNIIEFIDANGNDAAGISLNRASSNDISDFIANSNGQYGVWVRQSNSNQIDGGDADDNASNGIYLGCFTSEPGMIDCKKNGISSGNRLFNLMVNDNGAHGIMIDSETRHTTVTDVSAQSNVSTDLDDETSGCGTNMWFDNSFGSVSQDCVDAQMLQTREHF